MRVSPPLVTALSVSDWFAHGDKTKPDRVEAASVKDYISQARTRQRAAADQLSELTEEMGLY